LSRVVMALHAITSVIATSLWGRDRGPLIVIGQRGALSRIPSPVAVCGGDVRGSHLQLARETPGVDGPWCCGGVAAGLFGEFVQLAGQLRIGPMPTVPRARRTGLAGRRGSSRADRLELAPEVGGSGGLQTVACPCEWRSVLPSLGCLWRVAVTSHLCATGVLRPRSGP
jgi:hypothetical protein